MKKVTRKNKKFSKGSVMIVPQSKRNVKISMIKENAEDAWTRGMRGMRVLFFHEKEKGTNFSKESADSFEKESKAKKNLAARPSLMKIRQRCFFKEKIRRTLATAPTDLDAEISMEGYGYQ